MIRIRNLFNKQWLLAVLLVLLPINNSYASGNRPVISYFVDNIIFEIIVSGGYYTLAVIAVLSALAWKFKKFREVLLSVLIAMFGIILLIFIYQAFEDFNWLP